MAETKLSRLELQPTVLTEETDAGAANFFKDCNRIRFRQGLPESLGGWQIESLGTTPGPGRLRGAIERFAQATYAATDTQINIGANPFSAPDRSVVWLLGDSEVGGSGQGLAYFAGSTDIEFSSTQSVTAGSALIAMVRSEFYRDNFDGGSSMVAGAEAGSQFIRIADPVNLFFQKDSVVVIELDMGGYFITHLSSDIPVGSHWLPLREPIPALPATVSAVNLFPVGAVFSEQFPGHGPEVAALIRFIAATTIADTDAQVTEPFPVSSAVANEVFDVRLFEQTFLDGDHVNATVVDIDPPSTNGVTSVGGVGIGIAQAAVLILSPSIEYTRYRGTVRAVHDWTDLDGQKWCAIGTEKKLYLINNNELFDITPLDSQGTLTNPFTTNPAMPGGGNDTQYVRVADVAHGRSPGDIVRFSGASLVSSIDMNGEWEVALVDNANSYLIFVGPGYVAPNVSGAGGTVAYEYDVKAGPELSSTVVGFGTGPYGGGPYGISLPGSSGGVTRSARVWSLDNFGQDLLASPSEGGLYHWSRVNGPGVRATLVQNAPASMQRLYVSSQARHVVAFGAGLGSTITPGEPDKLLVRWADQENFNVWAPTPQNRAGDYRLDNGSEIVAAVKSRNDFIVFTDQSIHAMQYIGGSLVYGFRPLGDSVAIMGPNAAVDVNGVVMFMAQDDFMIYDGTLRPMPCSVRNHVFGDINREQGVQVFGSVNKSFTEIWWHYPSAGSTVNNRYVKYNYVQQSWDYGVMSRSAFHDSSAFLGAPYGFNNGLMYRHEIGVNDTDETGDPLPMGSFIETYDLDIEDGDSLFLVNQMVPDFKVLEGATFLRVSGRPYPQDPRIEKGDYIVMESTPRVDLRFKCRQIAYRVSSIFVGDKWRMGTWRAQARPHGRRGSR